MRKIAALLVALGLTLGLLGAGISATFTDTATAEVGVQVGTFGISISSAQGTVTGSSVYYDAGFIQSSVAGSRAFTFTITNDESIPATISIVATVTGPAAFSAVAPPVSFTLAQGESHVVTGGIQWDELFNPDLGQNASVSYAITATQ